MKCSIEGCDMPHLARGMCSRHYEKWRRHGDPLEPDHRRPNGAGSYAQSHGYHVVGGFRTHRTIAEKAVGRELPPRVQVHHVDGDITNNEPSNLVVCPSAAYHKLLHRRTRAFEQCGNADYRKCVICQTYDAPENLYINGAKVQHRSCKARYERERKRKRETT